MSTIAVRNANQMMISADIRDDGIFVSYADGRSGVVPYSALEGIGGPASIEQLELPNPYEVVLAMADGSREELPWDFVRWHCDDSFGARTESTLLREREAVRRRRVEVDPSDAIIGLTHKLSAGGNLGHTRHTIRIETPDRSRGVDFENALIDTGAALPILPSSALYELGITPTGRTQGKLADGSIHEFPRGSAYVSLNILGNVQGDVMPVLFGPDDEEAVIGVVPLEIFGIIVDPVEGRLLPYGVLRV